MSWQKEKSEHPWATKAQAKRIARDHAAKKHRRHTKNPNSQPLQVAAQDAKHLEAGFHRITYGKHEIGR